MAEVSQPQSNTAHRPAAVLGGGQQAAQDLQQQRADGGGVDFGHQLREALASSLAHLVVQHLQLARVELHHLPQMQTLLST